MAIATPASAKSYVDTKKRFSMELPAGWKLNPMPGDTTGMMFRKDSGKAFGLLQVSVRPARPGETVDDALKAYIAPFATELGYQKGVELGSNVGLLPAKQQSFSVYASGDKSTVRAIEAHVLRAFGYIHVLHFETLEANRNTFRRDFDRIIASYQARAGRSIHAPLVARWQTSGGPDLVLTEDDTFKLGPLSGVWNADGGRLVLHVDNGKENYRYTLKDRELTLTSTNLDAPLVYRRTGGQITAGEDDEKSPTRVSVSRDALIGSWHALDAASTEPLVLRLAPTGSVSFGPLSGRWWYRRGLLSIQSTAGETQTYNVSLSPDGRRITLRGGDLDESITLERE